MGHILNRVGLWGVFSFFILGLVEARATGNCELALVVSGTMSQLEPLSPSEVKERLAKLSPGKHYRFLVNEEGKASVRYGTFQKSSSGGIGIEDVMTTEFAILWEDTIQALEEADPMNLITDYFQGLKPGTHVRFVARDVKSETGRVVRGIIDEVTPFSVKISSLQELRNAVEKEEAPEELDPEVAAYFDSESDEERAPRASKKAAEKLTERARKRKPLSQLEVFFVLIEPGTVRAFGDGREGLVADYFEQNADPRKALDIRYYDVDRDIWVEDKGFLTRLDTRGERAVFSRVQSHDELDLSLSSMEVPLEGEVPAKQYFRIQAPSSLHTIVIDGDALKAGKFRHVSYQGTEGNEILFRDAFSGERLRVHHSTLRWHWPVAADFAKYQFFVDSERMDVVEFPVFDSKKGVFRVVRGRYLNVIDNDVVIQSLDGQVELYYNHELIGFYGLRNHGRKGAAAVSKRFFTEVARPGDVVHLTTDIISGKGRQRFSLKTREVLADRVRFDSLDGQEGFEIPFEYIWLDPEGESLDMLIPEDADGTMPTWRKVYELEQWEKRKPKP